MSETPFRLRYVGFASILAIALAVLEIERVRPVLHATGYLPQAAPSDASAGPAVETGVARDHPRNIRGRLEVRGRTLTYPDATPFRWRFATGFGLLEQVAHGRETEAVRFLRWAHNTGFNGVRVLTMAAGLFALTPQDGRTALPRFLDLAAKEDVYVELVALADTRAYKMSVADLTGQVGAIAGIAARYPHAMVQIANEYYHPTQVDTLHDAAVLRDLGAVVPASVLYTLSPAADADAIDPQGEYITRHLERSGNQWTQIARVRELAVLSETTGKPVINDEPIGADERNIPGRRLADPDAFFAQGVLARIFEIGTTFHFEAGLTGQLPRPNQQRCAAAFIAGTALGPDDLTLTFKDATLPDSPVRTAGFDRTVLRVYSGVNADRGYTVALGVRGDPRIEWQNGWQPTRELARRPGVIVWDIVRQRKEP
jgi:hypothetical protein